MLTVLLELAVGTIVKVGSALKGFSVGERVGFMMFKDMCGTNVILWIRMSAIE